MNKIYIHKHAQIVYKLLNIVESRQHTCLSDLQIMKLIVHGLCLINSLGAGIRTVHFMCHNYAINKPETDIYRNGYRVNTKII